eukprot:5422599-Pyramimonas_sp.AAC.1
MRLTALCCDYKVTRESETTVLVNTSAILTVLLPYSGTVSTGLLYRRLQLMVATTLGHGLSRARSALVLQWGLQALATKCYTLTPSLLYPPPLNVSKMPSEADAAQNTLPFVCIVYM